jgi:hypothetical protein
MLPVVFQICLSYEFAVGTLLHNIYGYANVFCTRFSDIVTSSSQKGSDQDLLFLREVVKDSGRKVQQLEYLVDELQFRFDSSLSLPGSMHNTLAKPSIFLIGGYNGVTWLSSLDSFSPEKDTMVGLTPMSFARSYASAAALDGHIFAFGGGGGKSSWYNTGMPWVSMI